MAKPNGSGKYDSSLLKVPKFAIFDRTDFFSWFLHHKVTMGGDFGVKIKKKFSNIKSSFTASKFLTQWRIFLSLDKKNFSLSFWNHLFVLKVIFKFFCCFRYQKLNDT